MMDYEKTAEPWIPLPPDEQGVDNGPVPVCPECGALVRRDLDEQHGWRCDLHGPQIPEWMYDEREDEE